MIIHPQQPTKNSWFGSFCTILLIIGSLSIIYDAAKFRYDASKRENSRCEQLKQISEALKTYSNFPEAVKRYATDLEKLSEVQKYDWNFGSVFQGKK